MRDHTVSIVFLLIVLIYIWLYESGKLGILKSVLESKTSAVTLPSVTVPTGGLAPLVPGTQGTIVVPHVSSDFSKVFPGTSGVLPSPGFEAIKP